MPVVIQARMGDKPGCFDRPMLGHGNHGQFLHIQSDRHGDGLALQEMNGRRLLAQDQLGAFCLPSWLSSSAVKVAIVQSRIVDPHPGFPSVDLQADKALAQIQFIQVQREGSRVKRRVIGSRWDAWLPLLFTGTLPFQECGEIAACFADHILNDRAAIASMEIWKRLAEVAIKERVWMLSSFYRL